MGATHRVPNHVKMNWVFPLLTLCPQVAKLSVANASFGACNKPGMSAPLRVLAGDHDIPGQQSYLGIGWISAIMAVFEGVRQFDRSTIYLSYVVLFTLQRVLCRGCNYNMVSGIPIH